MSFALFPELWTNTSTFTLFYPLLTLEIWDWLLLDTGSEGVEKQPDTIKEAAISAEVSHHNPIKDRL